MADPSLPNSSNVPTVSPSIPPPPTVPEQVVAQAPLYNHEIEADFQDDDSAIGGFSDTTSLISAGSSVYDFVTREDGRTYHRYKDGKYQLPNDLTEQDRLNLQHHLWLLTLDGKLSLAPHEKVPTRVLDIGTGTGIWAIEYAELHPETQVIGSDLSPIQPDYIPANCNFEVEDLDEETWVYSQPFDLIHGRALVSCLPRPQHFFAECFRSLAPGGYIELQDVELPATSNDGSMRGTNLELWQQYFLAGFAALGNNVQIVDKYAQWMREAGFVNVEEKLFYWPLNTWPKDPGLKRLGFIFRDDMFEVLQSLKGLVMKGSGLGLEEVDAFNADVKRDLMDRRIHAYHNVRVIVGQKPERA